MGKHYLPLEVYNNIVVLKINYNVGIYYKNKTKQKKPNKQMLKQDPSGF